MSKYTTLLRWPIENRLDELGLEHTEQNWPRVYGFLGLDDYPIFNESHRQTINDKIIRRYYMREIGFETVGLFVWNLRTHMHEIMPYYNDLYRSQLMVTEPMLSKSMTYEESWQTNDKVDGTRNVTDERKTETSNDGTSSSTSQDRNVYQDTPMNGLDTGAVESMDYATNVTFDNGSTNGTTSSTGVQDYTGTTDETTGETGNHDGTKAHTEKGFDRPQSELLLTYRKTLVNIDLMIVESCASLFMGLW